MDSTFIAIYLFFVIDLLKKCEAIRSKIELNTRESGDCLIWTGPVIQGGAPVVTVDRKKLYVKRHYLQLTGMVLGKKLATSSCANQLCVNHDHLVALTKTQLAKRTAASGAWSTPAIKARVAQGLRARSKLSQESVLAIRTSDEPVKVLAARHDISEAYAYMIRRGDWRRDYSATPFSGLGSRS